MITGLILTILAGMFFGEAENILMWRFNKKWKVKPLLWEWDWYVANNWKYDNKYIQFLMRYPFSFLKDGFHFTKTLGIVLLIAGLYFLNFGLIENILLAYIVYGIGFNIGYHY